MSAFLVRLKKCLRFVEWLNSSENLSTSKRNLISIFFFTCRNSVKKSKNRKIFCFKITPIQQPTVYKFNIFVIPSSERGKSNKKISNTFEKKVTKTSHKKSHKEKSKSQKVTVKSKTVAKKKRSEKSKKNSQKCQKSQKVTEKKSLKNVKKKSKSHNLRVLFFWVICFSNSYLKWKLWIKHKSAKEKSKIYKAGPKCYLTKTKNS